MYFSPASGSQFLPAFRPSAQWRSAQQLRGDRSSALGGVARQLRVPARCRRLYQLWTVDGKLFEIQTERLEVVLVVSHDKAQSSRSEVEHKFWTGLHDIGEGELAVDLLLVSSNWHSRIRNLLLESPALPLWSESDLWIHECVINVTFHGNIRTTKKTQG